MNKINCLAVRLAVVCVAVVGLANVARADDNPTGTWKWMGKFGERTFERTIKLKLEGDKLTGVVLGRENRETPIEEGSFKDGTVSFKVTRERNGRKFSSTHSGKVSGDSIKGEIKFERNGQTESRPWEATRAKD